MNRINNHKAQLELLEGSAVIIDVREPSEYKEHHIPGALNIPSTKFNKEHFGAFKDQKTCLVCQSGQRATMVGNKLQKEGFNNIFLLDIQMEDIPKLISTKGWSVDRQFRFLIGLLLAIFIILYFSNITYGVIIPIILSSGLLITAIIDKCYLRMGIAMLPWNKGKIVPN